MKLDKLGQLYRELTDKKHDFQEMMEEAGLTDLQTEIYQLEKQVRSMTSDFGNEVPEDEWIPDSFSKGKKEIFFDGTTGLLRTTKLIREIDPEIMVDEFPLLVNALVEEGKVKFFIKDVEPRISEPELESIITLRNQHSYEVVLRKTAKPTKKKGEKKKEKIKVKA